MSRRGWDFESEASAGGDLLVDGMEATEEEETRLSMPFWSCEESITVSVGTRHVRFHSPRLRYRCYSNLHCLVHDVLLCPTVPYLILPSCPTNLRRLAPSKSSVCSLLAHLLFAIRHFAFGASETKSPIRTRVDYGSSPISLRTYLLITAPCPVHPSQRSQTQSTNRWVCWARWVGSY